MEGLDLEKIQAELSGVMDMVVQDVKEKFRQLNQGPAILDSLRAFAAAVDWKEPWIIGLLSFHGVLLVAVLAIRRNQLAQGLVFFFIMGVVYNAERLNSLAAAHWRRFSGQNYFDAQGIFTSALLSGPLLLIMFVQLINYLLITSRLLIEMKRKELVYKARQQQAAQAGAAAGGGTAAGAGAEPKKDK